MHGTVLAVNNNAMNGMSCRGRPKECPLRMLCAGENLVGCDAMRLHFEVLPPPAFLLFRPRPVLLLPSFLFFLFFRPVPQLGFCLGGGVGWLGAAGGSGCGRVGVRSLPCDGLSLGRGPLRTTVSDLNASIRWSKRWAAHLRVGLVIGTARPGLLMKC